MLLPMAGEPVPLYKLLLTKQQGVEHVLQIVKLVSMQFLRVVKTVVLLYKKGNSKENYLLLTKVLLDLQKVENERKEKGSEANS